MAAGDIILTGTISTSAASDVYPTHKAELCLGGYRSVADIAARNAIPSQRREEGMAVYVIAENKKYILKGGIADTNWVEDAGGGGGSDEKWIQYGDTLPEVSAVPDGGFFCKGALPFNFLKGADGVSGFVPDYGKGIVETVTSASASLKNTTASCDGWMLVDVGISGTPDNSSNFSVSIDGKVASSTHPRAYQNVVFLPVKKGSPVIISTSLSFSRCDVTTFPIYKPELTDEHIVSYLNGKPVYEKVIEATSGSQLNKSTVIATLDTNIDLLFVTGFLTASGIKVPINYSDANSSGLATCQSVFYSNYTIVERHREADFSNARMVIKIQYTKTTD